MRGVGFRKEHGVILDESLIDELINLIGGDESAQPDLNDQAILKSV